MEYPPWYFEKALLQRMCSSFIPMLYIRMGTINDPKVFHNMKYQLLHSDRDAGETVPSRSQESHCILFLFIRRNRNRFRNGLTRDGGRRNCTFNVTEKCNVQVLGGGGLIRP